MPESIGQRLKKEREARYLTLEKVSQVTRIRTIHLKALEADDYSALPSAAQGRGFLRNYAEYLELNIDEMVAELQREAPPVDVSGPLPQVNLVETEIPPLVNEPDEKPAPRFFDRWLGRRPKTVSAPEVESTEEPSAPVAETKPEGQSRPIETDQPEVMEEAQTSLLSKFESLFRSGIEKINSKPEIAPIVEPAAPRSIPSLPADIIFVEIGNELRARRELISLTIEEVERHTKLRAVFVKALEAGVYDELPSSVQTRGMLANYAAFLDMDVDALLLRFADGLQARRHEKYSETPREKIQTEVITSMPLWRSFIAGDLIFGVVMVVTLFALAVWGVGRAVSSQNIQPTEPAAINVIGGTLTPTVPSDLTLVPVDQNPIAGTSTLPALNTTSIPTSNANVAVGVFAVERVFVRILVDGKIVFEGRMSPRESKLFEADQQIVILTGNAAALRITFNGNDLGFMGNNGEVLTLVYLITGVATPTATIQPTPTNTVPVTPTLTPKPTTTPTITATP